MRCVRAVSGLGELAQAAQVLPHLGVGNAPLEVAGSRSAVSYALFPQGHPYNNAAQSPLADLPKITPADIKAACGPYYIPNNAVIAVSGDFDPGVARKWIEQYFGDIPRGAPVQRAPATATSLTEEKRLVLEDPRLTVPLFRVVWLGAAILGYTSGEMLEDVDAVGDWLPSWGDWELGWLPFATAALVVLAGLAHRLAVRSAGGRLRDGDEAEPRSSKG